MSRLRAIIVTPGEPGGVGTEIVLKAWRHLHSDEARCFALLGDADHVGKMARLTGLDVPVQTVASIAEAADCFTRALPVLHRALPVPVKLGSFTDATARWVTSAIEEAVELCLTGAAAAMTTCPIQKEALYAAGFPHQGHTDFLAHLARLRGHQATEVMMLVGGGLRAVPVTVHIALKDVPSALSAEAIVAQGRVVADCLQTYFGVAVPRLAVTGLNPHAGENGAMGTEEQTIIAPAIAQLRRDGLQVTGPVSADTAFMPDARASYDAILCMYHDQALIPVKTLDFHGGVNVTLGLPFVRTSPDHGTALALAGTGKAQGDSLVAALTLAADMALRAGR